MPDVLLLIAGIFFLLSIHPYTIYPLTLSLMRRKKLREPGPEWVRPSVAICMSAFNEEKVIIAKVEQLLEMAAVYGPATIHIYVDGAEDNTAALLEPYRDRLELVVSAQRRGKTAGLKDLVAGSTSQVIAFTDANVQVPAESLMSLTAALEDPEVCCASARLVYTNADETGVSASGAAYWGVEEIIKSLESETVGIMGVDGAMFVIERDAYSPPPDDLIDDLYISVSALLTGKRVVSAQSVLVEERSATRWDEEFRRKARISCQATRVHFALWPKLRASRPIILYAYLSHRVLKWATPANLAATAIFFLTGLCLKLGSIVPLAVAGALTVGLLLGAWVNLPFTRMILTALVSLIGVGWGQYEALFTNRTYVTWTPAATVRN
jgi:cellulose synthase/poly-beta-1,6-N-acetylglucosamine synthase-like glycosyltransferase